MNIELRILTLQDISQRYVDWFSDEEVVLYSDNQYRQFTFESQKKYLSTILEDKNIELYGIFDNNFHIGNITITGLLSRHKRAEISYVIGERSYWGKGIATKAIAAICEKSKFTYKLNKLYAGCAEKNEGSKKALTNNGFTLEGTKKNHLLYNGEWMDQLDYGLLL